jgi:hypothetical protein
MDNLPAEMLHHFPHGAPASYLRLLNDHYPRSLVHECTLAILYALKTLHLIIFLTYPATQDAPYKYMPHDLSYIICNVQSFATTLSPFQTEAISEMSLHSSIHSSKINKLLPTPLIGNKIANNQVLYPLCIKLH